MFSLIKLHSFLFLAFSCPRESDNDMIEHDSEQAASLSFRYYARVRRTFIEAVVKARENKKQSQTLTHLDDVAEAASSKQLSASLSLN